MGPTWEWTSDGSTVRGRAIATVQDEDSETNIPWLLLSAAKTTGPGVFASVEYLQRLYTEGGAAPASRCCAGDTLKVPYAAGYMFYRSASMTCKSP